MTHFTVTEYQNVLRELKSIKLAGFRSYDFWHFICISIYRYMVLDHDLRKESCVRRVGRSLYAIGIALLVLVRERYDLAGLDNANGKTLLFTSDYYNNRKDMQTTMQTVSSSSEEIVSTRTQKMKRFAPNPIYPVLAVLWFMRIRKLDVPSELKIFMMRIIAGAYLFRNCIRKHADTLLRANALLSLNDENFDENLLFQFFKSHGIPTATLQHGHFWNTKDSEDLKYYAHNFKELTADYFFAWGQYTCDLAVRDGVPSDRVIPVGIPKYIGCSEKLPIRHEKVFGVFFDTPATSVMTNMELAKFADSLAEANGYSFYVKLHPTDSAERYDGLFGTRFLGFAGPCTVPEFSQTIDFSLVCLSTVFFEQIFFDKPVFRYLSPASIDVYEGLDFSAFSDETQLQAIMEMYLHDEQDYMNRLREMAGYCCGKGDIAENYRNAIHWLNGLKQ